MKTFALVLLLSMQQPQAQPWWGQVITSEHGRIGQAEVSAGTTVYVGDKLSTPEKGNLQIRTRDGCTRLLLLPATDVDIEEEQEGAVARLIDGVVTFGTARKCFKAVAGKLTVKPKEDKPTLGQVIYVLIDKEAIVVARQGSLIATIDGEEKIINEGECYRVVFTPVPVPQEAAPPAGGGVGQGIPGSGGPKKAGLSHFLITAMTFIGIATWFAGSEALESPFRP